MKNITVSIPDESYRLARVWAAERGVSLSKIVAYMLETLPQTARAARRFPHPNQHATLPVVSSPVDPGTPLNQKNRCETVKL